MATTQFTYTGDGSTTDYTLIFPYIAVADVRASLDGTGTTAFSLINATTLRFTAAPGNGVAIRIYRETNDDHKRIVFTPGSSIRANDLNDALNRNIFLSQELSNNLISVSSGGVANGSLTTVKLADDVVTDAKLSHTSVTPGDYTRANITVNQQGRITSASSNSSTVDDTDLTASGVTAGTYNFASVTVNAKGRVTAASSVPINTANIDNDAVTDAKLSDTGVTAGTYVQPNITVNAQGRITAASSSGTFTAGMIVMFTGATAPTGWALCNGQNGTPDLRDRFIVGSGSTYSTNATGGSADAVLVSHSHGISEFPQSEDSGNPDKITPVRVSEASTTPSGSMSTDSQGVSGTNQNLPPYYALAFIVKT